MIDEERILSTVERVVSLGSTFNAFNSADRWRRAFAVKPPLQTLQSGASLGYQWWMTASHGSLWLTQGASSGMLRQSQWRAPVTRVRRGGNRIMVRANRYALTAALNGAALEPGHLDGLHTAPG
jgi:hypothetical protein